MRPPASSVAQPAADGAVELSGNLDTLPTALAALCTMEDAREIRLRLEGTPHRWPSEGQVREMVLGRLAVIDVVEEVHLHPAAADETLDFLRFVRDSMAYGLHVRWRGQLGAGIPVRAISHLIPPVGGTGLALNPAVAAWRQQFMVGRFYWRAGPGFMLVRDSRPGRLGAGWTVTDPVTLRLLEQAMRPTPRASYGGDPAAASAIQHLLERETLLQCGDLLVTLPYRMRRWPIMYCREPGIPPLASPPEPDRRLEPARGDAHV